MFDVGTHAQIREFLSGGSRPDGQKTAWYFIFYFFNPELILQFTEGVQWFYDIKNLYFPKDPEGVQYFFQGGGAPIFSRGVQMHIL